MGDRFDESIVGWLARWTDEGYIRFGYQVSADVAAVIVETLGSREPESRVTAAAELT
jgi:hypothetical protein